MNRKLLLILGLAYMATAPMLAHAASQEDDDARRRAQADAARKKAEKAKQWDVPQARLPSVKNVGPCPFVKVLYDAARYQEFTGSEATGNVGFTGEINNVEAKCQYSSDSPINVQVAVQFALGKGPKAIGDVKEYRYWVAVTERNTQVLAKQTFTVRAEFPAGQDRTRMADTIENIVIPRATATTSGSNFEILVGFEVTPAMAEFNRLGKRFRANAVGAQATASGQ